MTDGCLLWATGVRIGGLVGREGDVSMDALVPAAERAAVLGGGLGSVDGAGDMPVEVGVEALLGKMGWEDSLGRLPVAPPTVMPLKPVMPAAPQAFTSGTQSTWQ